MANIAARDGPERRKIGEVAGHGLARVDERRARCQRLLDRGDGGERLVVDVDPLSASRAAASSSATAAATGSPS